MDCIECGCCSYICPARLPLVQIFRAAKAAIRERAAKARETSLQAEVVEEKVGEEETQ